MNTTPLNVFICGSGHSGTTLLDMLLGGHPLVSALGEVGALQFNIQYDGEADRCACGEVILKCEFWKAVDNHLRQQNRSTPSGLRDLLLAQPEVAIRRFDNGQFHSRLPGERRLKAGFIRNLALMLNSRLLLDMGSHVNARAAMWKQIYRDRNALYSAIREVHETSVVVDSTKNPGYLKGVWWYRNAPMKVIEVVRDGRAVCWSRTKREGWTMEEAIQIWIREYQKRKIALKSIPAADCLRVYYENLATHPIRQLREIADFLGIEVKADEMLQFRRARHNVGGNPMRYLSDSEGIHLDQKWKRRISKSELSVFERKGSWLNQRFGYY